LALVASPDFFIWGRMIVGKAHEEVAGDMQGVDLVLRGPHE